MQEIRRQLLVLHHYFHLSRKKWAQIQTLAGADNDFLWRLAQQLEPRREEKIPADWFAAYRSIDWSSLLAYTYLDADYPLCWQNIPSSPLVVYFAGKRRSWEADLAVAIVGTRKPSAFGQQNAEYFSLLAARADYTIISGLALGIDTLAHQAAVRQNTATIAFLGSGLGHIYPRENADLAKAILENNGLLCSEYPQDISPRPQYFPIRNRLIAASANCTLVVEAALKSGAYITGKLAAELGKNLLVLTQDFRHSAGQGAITLIQEANALPLLNGTQFLECLGYSRGGISLTVKNNAVQEFTISELQEKWQIDFPATIQRLMQAVAKGKWRALGGDKFAEIKD